MSMSGPATACPPSSSIEIDETYANLTDPLLKQCKRIAHLVHSPLFDFSESVDELVFYLYVMVNDEPCQLEHAARHIQQQVA